MTTGHGQLALISHTRVWNETDWTMFTMATLPVEVIRFISHIGRVVLKLVVEITIVFKLTLDARDEVLHETLTEGLCVDGC